MKIKPTNEMRQAAFMAGLPVTLWISQTLYRVATETNMAAHEALVKAGLRNEGQMKHLEEQRVERLREQAMRRQAKAALPLSKRNNGANHHASDVVTNVVVALPDVPDTDWHQNKLPTIKAASLTMRQRGLVADLRGDYWNQHNVKCGLTDRHIWDCWQRVYDERNAKGYPVDDDVMFQPTLNEMRAIDNNH